MVSHHRVICISGHILFSKSFNSEYCGTNHKTNCGSNYLTSLILSVNRMAFMLMQHAFISSPSIMIHNFHKLITESEKHYGMGRQFIKLNPELEYNPEMNHKSSSDSWWHDPRDYGVLAYKSFPRLGFFYRNILLCKTHQKQLGKFEFWQIWIKTLLLSPFLTAAEGNEKMLTIYCVGVYTALFPDVQWSHAG